MWRLHIYKTACKKLLVKQWKIVFWVFPRRLSIKSRRFGTLCRFHLQQVMKFWSEDKVFLNEFLWFFYLFIVSEIWNLRSAVYEMEKSFSQYHHIPDCNPQNSGATWMILRNFGHFFQTSSLEAISITKQIRNVYMT
jgi:hypothetical protein